TGTAGQRMSTEGQRHGGYAANPMVFDRSACRRETASANFISPASAIRVNMTADVPQEGFAMPRWLPLLALAVVTPTAVGTARSESAAQDRKEEPTKKERDQFASDQAKDMGKSIPFDGGKAIGYLKQICDLGPRISGSEGMKQQQELLQTHFEKFGGKVSYQRFEA